MRRRTSLAAVLALGVTWAASACGIPSGKAPEVIGDAPSDFDQSSGTSAEVYGPTDKPEETVQNYLKAAAGDPDGRNDRLNAFTVGGEQEFSDPSTGLDLLAGAHVAIDSNAGVGSATVKVTGSVVGTYLSNGSVRMNSAPRDYDESFTLQRESLQDNWKITVPPNQAMLDYSYFTTAYEEVPLYFQAGQRDLLVPDLRWIFADLDPEIDRRLRLGWLLLGPSEFVSVAARNAVPEGTAGRVGDEDGEVGIELTTALGDAVDEDTSRAIAAQVAWSLGLDSDFTLTVDGGEAFHGSLDNWRAWNAIPASDALSETGYFIAEDTVWEYTSNEEVTTASADHTWVGFTLAGLRQVAVGVDGRIAAVVQGAGTDTLQVGTRDDAMQVMAQLSGSLADPQWLSDTTVMVIDDGTPTAVDTRTGAVQTLEVGDAVTSLALAADGRRLAFVEDGLAWIAPLSVNADGNLQAGEPKPIGLDITDVTDVAWSSENYLWVAGVRGDDRLLMVAVDNSRTEVQDWTLGLDIAQVAANPADPVESSLNRGEPVLVVANATLYRVHFSGPVEVENGNHAVAATAPFTVPQ
ncbi:hypothetical protein LO763_24365 [Glycomyces sp. A-F 0318]|uniref:LpqB family beta-propeller domain-containing protein n=1 Tax=Glycomyces amatae TaxID=2881355 RepID=UPI001E35AEB1|nr:LpqB family beta-propeller domain-containing protein [Glycomyces amatae]MCD0446758.1 hypothetical protein [Glycomyces amatae]